MYFCRSLKPNSLERLLWSVLIFIIQRYNKQSLISCNSSFRYVTIKAHLFLSFNHLSNDKNKTKPLFIFYWPVFRTIINYIFFLFQPSNKIQEFSARKLTHREAETAEPKLSNYSQSQLILDTWFLLLWCEVGFSCSCFFFLLQVFWSGVGLML